MVKWTYGVKIDLETMQGWDANISLFLLMDAYLWESKRFFSQMQKMNNIHPNSKLEVCFLGFQQKLKIDLYEEKYLINVSNQRLKQRFFTLYEIGIKKKNFYIKLIFYKLKFWNKLKQE